MIYYLAIAAIGYVSYKKWENEMNLIFIKSVFEITKLYHKMNDYFVDESIVNEKEDIEEIKKNLFEIKDNKNYELSLDIPKDKFISKLKESIIVLSINDNMKLLKEEDYEDINKLEKIDIIKDKIFLQIILSFNGKETEIQNKIKNYLVEKNILFEYDFLKWFMDYNYNIKIDKDYEISIMDNNINLFTIKKGQSIKIIDGFYEIINK